MTNQQTVINDSKGDALAGSTAQQPVEAVSVKGQPLFTAEETAAREAAMKEIDQSRGDGWWSERQALQRSQTNEMVERAKARPDEFLDALLYTVGTKGERYIHFGNAFARSTEGEYRALIDPVNTPENRRTLHTVLRGLAEVPRSWACSAVTRHFRGTGRQKDDKYAGCGVLGADYGWTTDQTRNVCGILADGSNPYSVVLMTYMDAQEALREAEEDGELDPMDRNPAAEFAATSVRRDTVFIDCLCGILEARGLAEMPEPKVKAPKKEHVPKVFQAGDIVTARNIRDLPLPALVEVTGKFRNAATDGPVDATMQVVVVELDRGSSSCSPIDDGKAYLAEYKHKAFLYGGKYLGPWTGPYLNKRHR